MAFAAKFFGLSFLIIRSILYIASFGKNTAIRTRIGMALARGELTLVVAKADQDIGAISSALLPVLSLITIITTFMTPYLLRFRKRKFRLSSDDSTYV